MCPTMILEWFFEDQWHEIGWRASNPESATDLREHGAKLASDGGRYRLVHLSIRAGQPIVIHEYPRAAATGGGS